MYFFVFLCVHLLIMLYVRIIIVIMIYTHKNIREAKPGSPDVNTAIVLMRHT